MLHSSKWVVMLDVTVEHLPSARSCPREEVCRDGVTEMRAHRRRMRLEFSWAEGGSGAGEKPLLRDAAAVGAAGLVTGRMPMRRCSVTMRCSSY